MQQAEVWRRFLRPIAILLVACLIFLPVIQGQFLFWDDYSMVVKNPALREGHALDVLDSWRHPVLQLYAPLTYTVYAGLSAVNWLGFTRLEPALFHSANLLAHAVSSVLVWLLLRRLTRDDAAALIGALVWTLHPIQVEPVAWVASLNTCLCTMLAMGALLLQTIAMEAAPRRRRTLWIAAGGLFALSMFAKPASIGLPLAILGVNRFILGQPWRRSLAVTAAAAVLTIPFILVGQVAQPLIVNVPLTMWQRLAVMGHSTAFYLYKIVTPHAFCIDYGLDPATVVADPTARLAGLTLLPVAAALIWQRRRRPWLVGAACVFAAGIGPVSGVRDFDFQSFSTVADRYAYFAMLGVAMAIAFSLRGRATAAATRWIAIAVLIALASMSFMRTLAWYDTETLRDVTVAQNPQSIAALILEGGMAESRRDVVAEESVCRRFLARRPDDPRMNQSMAYLLMFTDRPGEAVTYFHTILSRQPNALIYSDLGLALTRSGQLPEALKAIDEAIRLDPKDPTKYANRGAVYQQLGDPARAIESFEAALRLDPRARDALDGLQKIRAGPTTQPDTQSRLPNR